MGVEPMTSCMPCKRAPNCATAPRARPGSGVDNPPPPKGLHRMSTGLLASLSQRVKAHGGKSFRWREFLDFFRALR